MGGKWREFMDIVWVRRDDVMFGKGGTYLWTNFVGNENESRRFRNE